MCVAPARCSFCEQKSSIHVVYGLLAMTTWIVITWVFIGLSYMSRSSFFLLGTLPALVLAVNKYLLQAPLRITHHHK
ncbi:MAG: hypothetical protein RQ899_11090 [Pseudomonadales bacterium]|nr:hypothetical protein [Pseudomonadales bacterium]